MTEFPRVGLFSKGYDCAQVDAFFEDARRAYEGGVPPEPFTVMVVPALNARTVETGAGPLSSPRAVTHVNEYTTSTAVAASSVP